MSEQKYVNETPINTIVRVIQASEDLKSLLRAESAPKEYKDLVAKIEKTDVSKAIGPVTKKALAKELATALTYAFQQNNPTIILAIVSQLESTFANLDGLEHDHTSRKTITSSNYLTTFTSSIGLYIQQAIDVERTFNVAVSSPAPTIKRTLSKVPTVNESSVAPQPAAPKKQPVSAAPKKQAPVPAPSAPKASTHGQSSQLASLYNSSVAPQPEVIVATTVVLTPAPTQQKRIPITLTEQDLETSIDQAFKQAAGRSSEVVFYKFRDALRDALRAHEVLKTIDDQTNGFSDEKPGVLSGALVSISPVFAHNTFTREALKEYITSSILRVALQKAVVRDTTQYELNIIPSPFTSPEPAKQQPEADVISIPQYRLKAVTDSVDGDLITTVFGLTISPASVRNKLSKPLVELILESAALGEDHRATIQYHVDAALTKVIPGNQDIAVSEAKGYYHNQDTLIAALAAELATAELILNFTDELEVKAPAPVSNARASSSDATNAPGVARTNAPSKTLIELEITQSALQAIAAQAVQKVQTEATAHQGWDEEEKDAAFQISGRDLYKILYNSLASYIIEAAHVEERTPASVAIGQHVKTALEVIFPLNSTFDQESAEQTLNDLQSLTTALAEHLGQAGYLLIVNDDVAQTKSSASSAAPKPGARTNGRRDSVSSSSSSGTDLSDSASDKDAFESDSEEEEKKPTQKAKASGVAITSTADANPGTPPRRTVSKAYTLGADSPSTTTPPRFGYHATPTLRDVNPTNVGANTTMRNGQVVFKPTHSPEKSPRPQVDIQAEQAEIYDTAIKAIVAEAKKIGADTDAQNPNVTNKGLIIAALESLGYPPAIIGAVYSTNTEHDDDIYLGSAEDDAELEALIKDHLKGQVSQVRALWEERQKKSSSPQDHATGNRWRRPRGNSFTEAVAKKITTRLTSIKDDTDPRSLLVAAQSDVEQLIDGANAGNAQQASTAQVKEAKAAVAAFLKLPKVAKLIESIQGADATLLNGKNIAPRAGNALADGIAGLPSVKALLDIWEGRQIQEEAPKVGTGKVWRAPQPQPSNSVPPAPAKHPLPRPSLAPASEVASYVEEESESLGSNDGISQIDLPAQEIEDAIVKALSTVPGSNIGVKALKALLVGPLTDAVENAARVAFGSDDDLPETNIGEVVQAAVDSLIPKAADGKQRTPEEARQVLEDLANNLKAVADALTKEPVLAEETEYPIVVTGLEHKLNQGEGKNGVRGTANPEPVAVTMQSEPFSTYTAPRPQPHFLESSESSESSVEPVVIPAQALRAAFNKAAKAADAKKGSVHKKRTAAANALAGALSDAAGTDPDTDGIDERTKEGLRTLIPSADNNPDDVARILRDLARDLGKAENLLRSLLDNLAPGVTYEIDYKVLETGDHTTTRKPTKPGTELLLSAKKERVNKSTDLRPAEPKPYKKPPVPSSVEGNADWGMLWQDQVAQPSRIDETHLSPANPSSGSVTHLKSGGKSVPPHNKPPVPSSVEGNADWGMLWQDQVAQPSRLDETHLSPSQPGGGKQIHLQPSQGGHLASSGSYHRSKVKRREFTNADGSYSRFSQDLTGLLRSGSSTSTSHADKHKSDKDKDKDKDQGDKTHGDKHKRKPGSDRDSAKR